MHKYINTDWCVCVFVCVYIVQADNSATDNHRAAHYS